MSSTRLRCKCGKVLRVPNDLAGTTARCPSCGLSFRVSATASNLESGNMGVSSAKDSTVSRPAGPVDGPPFASGEVGALQHEGGAGKAPPKAVNCFDQSGRFCEKCGSPLSPDAIFCSKCGSRPRSANEIGSKTDEDIKAPAVTAAAVLMFVWAGLWAVVVLMQLGILLAGASLTTGLLAGWNAIIVGAYIVIGLGTLKRKRWGYEWGVGTNGLNLLWGAFQLFFQSVFVQILFLPIEIAIVVLLVVARGAFAIESKMADGETSARNKQSLLVLGIVIVVVLVFFVAVHVMYPN